MSDDAPAAAAPAWTWRCFASGDLDTPVPPDARLPGQPAPQFVGMTYEQLRRLATADDFHLIVVGKAGHCLQWVQCLDAGGHVWAALDAEDRVIAARDGGVNLKWPRADRAIWARLGVAGADWR